MSLSNVLSVNLHLFAFPTMLSNLNFRGMDGVATLIFAIILFKSA